MKKKYLLFVLFFVSSVLLTSCELFEDIVKDTPVDTRKKLIGLWKNDSLETRYYENGVLITTDKQSLEGYTFEIKKDDSYINTNPAGVAYFKGTWELTTMNQTTQILLDVKTSDERRYNILTLTQNSLITNRVITLSETSSVEYIFTYNK